MSGGGDAAQPPTHQRPPQGLHLLGHVTSMMLGSAPAQPPHADAPTYLPASLSVTSWRPRGSGMESSNRRDHPLLLAIGLKAFREARRLVGGGGIAARAWCTGCAAGTCMRSGPWLVGMFLADPAGVVAQKALHRLAPLSHAGAHIMRSLHAETVAQRKAEEK